MRLTFQTFYRSQSGATAIEYALIASLISIAIVVGLTATSGQVRSLYTTIGDQVTTALSP